MLWAVPGSAVTWLLATWEVPHDHSGIPGGPSAYLVAILLAVAVGLSRRAPESALAVAWCLGLLHVATGVQPAISWPVSSWPEEA